MQVEWDTTGHLSSHSIHQGPGAYEDIPYDESRVRLWIKRPDSCPNESCITVTFNKPVNLKSQFSYLQIKGHGASPAQLRVSREYYYSPYVLAPSPKQQSMLRILPLNKPMISQTKKQPWLTPLPSPRIIWFLSHSLLIFLQRLYVVAASICSSILYSLTYSAATPFCLW